MSFLGDLFKRKPGGTALGNALRGVASKLTGGVLGQGAMMIPENEYDKNTLSDQDYLLKYGVNKAGIPGYALAQQMQTAVSDVGQAATGAVITDSIKRYWWLGLIPFGFIVLGIILFRKKKKGGKVRYN